MEYPGISEMSGKSCKKVKAIGAFRVFLNFLQKSNKKKMENSPKSESASVISDGEVVTRVSDLEPDGSVGEFESRYQCGDGSEGEAALSHPERFVPNQDGTKKQSSCSDIDDDDDDEVFLNESYFEDDYFEDFSSSGNVKDDGIDDLDKVVDVINDSILNNLDTSDVIDKNYDKILPDSIWHEKVEAPLEHTRFWPKPHPQSRRRHSSMPSLSCDPSQDPCGTDPNNLLSNRSDLVQLLQKPIPYFGLTTDILNPNILNQDMLRADILNQDMLGTDVFNKNILNQDNLNMDILPPDISTLDNEITKGDQETYNTLANHDCLDTSSLDASSPRETHMLEGSPISPRTDSTESCDSSKITSNSANSNTGTTPPGDNPSVSTTACSEFNSGNLSKSFKHFKSETNRSKSRVYKMSMLERRDSSLSLTSYFSGFHKDISKSTLSKGEVTKSKLSSKHLSKSTPSSKEEKEQMNETRRMCKGGSIESGYGSVRMSSASTPLSPLISPPLSPPLSVSTPMTKLHRGSQFTPPAGSQFTPPAGSPFTPPAEVFLSTPMNKLHKGTPLSPRSLNILDGVSKTPSHRKRTLKPKFIFPTPVSSDLKPVPSSNLKPVPLSNLKPVPSSDLKPVPGVCGEIEVRTGKDDTGHSSNPNGVTLREEPMPLEPVDLCTGYPDKIGLPVHGPGFHLNLSISFLDINNNIHPHHNEPQAAMHMPSSTPLREERRTAPSGCYNMADILTPSGKSIQPVCTSSPLWVKLGHYKPAMTPHDILGHNSGTTPLKDTSGHDKPGTTPYKDVLGHHNCTAMPLCKLVLESSALVSPGVNDVQHVAPISLPAKTKKIDEDARVVKPMSERRKKLKRRSARTQLHFDERVDENNNVKKVDDDEDDETGYNPKQGDYVLLKRIADSIINECGYRYSDAIGSFVDLAGLIDCLNTQYSKLVEYYDVTSRPRLSSLKKHVESSRQAFADLTVHNCLTVVLVSFLVQNVDRIRTSLDFCFDNLPRVLHEHESLGHLSPEIVVLLLSNPRRVVHNHHGFPLSYSSSEREVFKAVVKYVDTTQKKNRRPLGDRVKSLLSTVADPQVLSDLSSQCVKTDLAGDVLLSHPRTITSKPPRPYHRLVFHQLCPLDRGDREYFLQPFISASVQSLDQISSNTKHGTASPVGLASVYKENYVLRKIYFSYRRHNDVPFITKIGMQYSCKGKKKTAFIAPSQPAGREFNSCKEPSETHERFMTSDTDREPKVDETPCASGPAGSGSSEMCVVKKAAVVLKPGEHITALSVLGQAAVHNVEVITSMARRIRAHGLADVADERWVAMETPQGKEPFCLHTIYGDAHGAVGRTHIRDLGAIWASTSYDPRSYEAINELG